MRARDSKDRLWLLAASATVALLLLIPTVSLSAGERRAADGACPPEMSGQPLIKVPEIGAAGGKLRGTVLLRDEQEWIPFRVPPSAPTIRSTSQCLPQYVRIFRDAAATPPLKVGGYGMPMPGPTLRARVGDLVEVTFINQIDASDFGDSIDRGETGKGNGCDQTSSSNTGDIYPGKDTFPDCFHGSSTGNIHFHGTHTNPNGTGDNVFIEVRPSLRENGRPVVTRRSVRKSFDAFFAACEQHLRGNPLAEWPNVWSDLPKAYARAQEALLKRYDKGIARKRLKLWPANHMQIMAGHWPQYYIGAFPYCYRLPRYPSTSWPPKAGAVSARKGAGTRRTASARLVMGQSPGTHWYHAHKHGSTAIDVANGMTGAFIIEGRYDDDLNAWYGARWTRTQPVIVINQLGVSPNLERGSGGQQDKGPDFSVNGRLRPVIQMRPGEVQMWRILNTSGRAGAFFPGPPPGFAWMQLAQDGVQFRDVNYKASRNEPLLMMSGNRADLLVRAPATPCDTAGGCSHPVVVQNEVDPSDLASAAHLTLLTVNVSGTPVDPRAHGGEFIPQAPKFPPFLADITGSEVKARRTMTFSSNGGSSNGGAPFTQHMIDGKKFDGSIGARVRLNRAEEWKIVNATYGPQISHPFHIHLNPFQVVEVFDPNEPLIDPKTGKPPIDPATGKAYVDPQTGKQAVKYAFHKDDLAPGQCYLDPDNAASWKPCKTAMTTTHPIWWDVFPIPSGYAPTDPQKKPLLDSHKKAVQVPGYFKMRSRFVDYPGFYVLHCHILAHEDRGMMTVVEVEPAGKAFSKKPPYMHT